LLSIDEHIPRKAFLDKIDEALKLVNAHLAALDIISNSRPSSVISMKLCVPIELREGTIGDAVSAPSRLFEHGKAFHILRSLTGLNSICSGIP
jgi:hypothetical protein